MSVEVKDAKELKAAIGYHDPSERCESCTRFKPSDEMSGRNDAKPDRCDTDLIWFKVYRAWWCPAFSKALPLAPWTGK